MNPKTTKVFEDFLESKFRKCCGLRMTSQKNLHMTFLTSSFLSSEFFKFKTLIFLQKSPIHGFGVFASEDIPAGTVVTCYPAHVAIFGSDCDGDSKCILKSRGLQQLVGDENLDFSVIRDYGFEINQNQVISGSPLLTNDVCYLGHMINDSCRPNSNLSLQEYKQKSIQGANCEFKFLARNLHVGILTVCKVQKDEELFISYGPDYWT